MKRLWVLYSAKIDALTLRERAALFLAAATLIVMIGYSFLLSPLFASRAALKEQISQQQNNLAGLDAEITARIDAYGVDPDAASRQQLSGAHAESGKLSASLRAMQQGLVSPEKIVPMLEVILKGNGRLHVMALRALPVGDLSDPLPSEVEAPVVKPAAPTSAELLASVVNPGEAVKESKESQEARVARDALAAAGQLLYRHGVEITVEGSYLDMVDYMSALEAMPTQLLWGKAAFVVQRYPTARLTLTLYTLSLDQKWMKL